jgi:signal transduction histidine kinase
MPSNKIFLSWFTLKFVNPDTEKDYAQTLNRNLNAKNCIYCILVLITLFILNILFWLREIEESTFTYIRMTILSHTVIAIVLFTLTLSSPRQLCTHKLIIYSNYYFLLFLEVGIMYYFVYVLGDNSYSFACAIYLIKNLFDLSFYFSKMLDFMEGALLTFAKFVSCYLFYAGLFPQFVLNQSIMLIMVCISYFYVYEQRKLYYYFKMTENNSLWYRNILESMISGFICITDKTIKYVNKPLMSIFEQIKDDVVKDVYEANNGSDEITSGEIEYNNKAGRNLICSILSGIFKNLKTNIESLAKEPDLDTIKTYLKRHSRDKFINLGSCSVVGTKINTIHFEIQGRYYTANQFDEEGDKFDFMLNDVSNIKVNEEMNAESKYKSMFLQKIAHEFKNPILSITELTEQIKENLESLIDKNDDTTEVLNKVNEIITSIKSMSDFLLILVKDLDYFSTKHNRNKKPAMEKDSVNVRSLLIFLTDITNILIKKYNKENQISFYIKYNTLPKEIYTDEIKLKQILINLLSNAVKYTLHGQIILDLNFINSGKLEITVMDTGKGLTEEKLKEVFKPYIEQNKELSVIGTGLGLNIVKDLIALFGSKISYEHNSPEGSIFKFDIKIDDIDNYIPNHLDIFEDASSEDFDKTTVEIDYQPKLLDRNIFDPEDLANPKSDIENLQTSANGDNINNSNINNSNNNSNNNNINNNNKEKSLEIIDTQITILVADDEVLTRKSTIRLINNYCLSKFISVNILEASDGVECLWKFYQCMIKGEKITLILSDETMTFMDGSYCANIMYELCSLRGFLIIPFYIVTAYETLHYPSNIVIKEVFTKPLSKVNLEKAFINLNNT